MVNDGHGRSGIEVNRLERLSTIIEPMIAALGYSLVRLQMTEQRSPRIQIMAERNDLRPLTIDDCADLSRALSAKLDEADLISFSYTLEVSSPGIDRPLGKLADFERFTGRLARIDLRESVQGRRRFAGRLLGIDGTGVRMQTNEAEVRLSFENISRAKLLMDHAILAGTSMADGAGRSSEAE